MFIGRGRAKGGLAQRAHGRLKRALARRAFTLLEIMLAVGILGLMSLAIFRFVQSNLTSLRLSSDISAADAQYDGLRALLAAEWQSLPPQRAQMYGEPFKLNDRQRDWVRWVCGAGQGMLTRYAQGDFVVTLGLRPEDEKSGRFDLGLLRKPKNDRSEEHETWVPLIKDVTSLQISYYSPRFGNNPWVDRWPGGTLPSLIKLTIGRRDSPVPWEAVIPLCRTPYLTP